MAEADFVVTPAVMLQEIEIITRACEKDIGKQALNTRVMETMGRVPRHEFVQLELRPYAYANTPLPIGYGKTISQPFIVALMTDLLEVQPQDRVLEIGTGLGYQAAILAELAAQVYSVEIIDELAQEAQRRLKQFSYANISFKIGNGYHGWPEHAPFDKIIATTAPELVPPPLLSQLRPGGRMVIPAGLADSQKLLLVVTDTTGKATFKEIMAVRFSELEGAPSLQF